MEAGDLKVSGGCGDGQEHGTDAELSCKHNSKESMIVTVYPSRAVFPSCLSCQIFSIYALYRETCIHVWYKLNASLLFIIIQMPLSVSGKQCVWLFLIMHEINTISPSS